MKKRINVIAAIVITVTVLSCGGGKNYRQVMKQPDLLFLKKQYKKAAAILKPYAQKQDKDQLLYMMEAGYLFHVAGDYKLSNTILSKAAHIAKVTPISISKQVASLLTNQRATNYRGEDFEKVLIRMFSGINYLMLKDYDAARVEFKSVNNELAKIKVEGKSRYRQNLMAKYMTAIAFETVALEQKDEEDLEFALVELRQILKIRGGLGMARADLNRLERMMENPNKWDQDQGELVLIYQSGQTAIKASRGGLLQSADMKAKINVSLRGLTLKQGVSIAAIMVAISKAENPIPKFLKRSNLAQYVRVKVAGRTLRSTQLESIENTAVKTLKDDYKMLSAKLAVSIVTKAAVSIAAGIAAKQVAKRMGAGAFSGLIGTVAGAGTGAALFSTIKPDLRCWHFLPANLQLVKTFLPPGEHIMALEYVGRGGRILLRENYKIKIEKGKKYFFNVRTLN